MAFSSSSFRLSHTSFRVKLQSRLFALRKSKARRGADIEQEGAAGDDNTGTAPAARTAVPNINEIDYCIAPADVSLARAAAGDADSLTRTLNNASNRAVRRILLSLSWPGDADALNRRLGSSRPGGSSRSESTYVADQLAAFGQRYGDMPGYNYARDYLACILSLAVGERLEGPAVPDVTAAGVYDEAYQRVLAVLARAGVQWRRRVDDDGSSSSSSASSSQRQIVAPLQDQDLCWSVLDTIALQQQQEQLPPWEEEETIESLSNDSSPNATASADSSTTDEETPKKKRRLGFPFRKQSRTEGILIPSNREPTMTRQLNVVSNIVQRTLLFGGEEELSFWITILKEDRKPFRERWYPDDSDTDDSTSTRPGLAYLDALIALLETCSNDRTVTTMEPAVPLSSSFGTAYQRLLGSAIESGSGYVTPSTTTDIVSIPLPRTPTEELGRFAVWETQFRSARDATTTYPDDLVGVWNVRDEVGGETIGTSTIELQPEGSVKVAATGLTGLRWRLDPGPTHLDTCSFQVLTNDGNLLLYRGFLDRGARLEARFSKRSIRIRGSVMFQMRDGGAGVDYFKDILPINYRTGTTKFSMTKEVDLP